MHKKGKTLTVAALIFSGLGFGKASAEPAPRQITIIVDGGYSPNRIDVKEGEPVTLVFERREHGPSTAEVVFPGLDIRRALPPKQRVAIAIPALKAGEYEWKCGMNMVSGTIAVSRGG